MKVSRARARDLQRRAEMRAREAEADRKAAELVEERRRSIDWKARDLAERETDARDVPPGRTKPFVL